MKKRIYSYSETFDYKDLVNAMERLADVIERMPKDAYRDAELSELYEELYDSIYYIRNSGLV